ncbi:MAG TPA: kelch repeat-containing protein, partial [Candidatus Acidoferrales bacterium]
MKRALKLVCLLAAVLCAVVLLKGYVLQVASGTWAPTASMAQARSGASAVLLQTGAILITGGDGASGLLADAELFSTDGTFSA